MCRFFACRADSPVSVREMLLDARHSLVAQSCRDLRGEAHCDGWGIGWYDGHEPRARRGTLAAGECPDFRLTAQRLASPTVLAHVRQASVGNTSLLNTHPFTHGRWLFAHNGTVTGYDDVRPRIEQETGPALRACVQGSTDSELVFFWILSQLGRHGLPAEGPATDPQVVRAVVADSLRRLSDWSQQAGADEPARLNFLLTDGATLVATRWKHSLHWQEWTADGGGNGGGGWHAPRRLVAVASEPIAERPWQAVPEESVLVVDPELRVEVTAV